MLSSNFSSPEMGVPWGLVKKALHFNSCLIALIVMISTAGCYFSISLRRNHLSSCHRCTNILRPKPTLSDPDLSSLAPSSTSLRNAASPRLKLLHFLAPSERIMLKSLLKQEKMFQHSCPLCLPCIESIFNPKQKRQKEAKKCILL